MATSAQSLHPCVFYYSVYGSTHSYAMALAERLGCEAVNLSDDEHAASTVDKHCDAGASPLVFLSPIYGPSLHGIDVAVHAAKRLDHRGKLTGARKVAFVTVGLSDPAKAVARDATAGLLGEERDRIDRFYVPGAIDFPRLSGLHRTVMRGMLMFYASKPQKTEFEKDLVASGAVGFDHVDVELLVPIVRWALTH